MYQVISTVTKDTEAKLYVQKTDSLLDDSLKPDEVIVKVEAAPINPSDLAVMLPTGTDMDALKTLKLLNAAGANEIGLTYQINEKFSKILAARVGLLTPPGNEGAGTVVKAGTSPEAQSLVGKVVGCFGGGMYTQYRKLNLKQIIPHNDGTTTEEAASSFVNPMTVLAMIESFRQGKHKAMIHTAAASNLGQMLQKFCIKENVPLINIVRKDEQEKILRDIGAKYVIRSDKETFIIDLANAVAETECTLAFDAIGGGKMASNLLTAMEMGAKKFSSPVDAASPYGTTVFKQVYIYGGLDESPTQLSRGFGFAWGINAWLMPNVLATLPPEKVLEMHKKVADNIKTIFKSEYYRKISLAEMVQPENLTEYIKQQTGKKFLVLPQKDIDQISNKL